MLGLVVPATLQHVSGGALAGSHGALVADQQRTEASRMLLLLHCRADRISTLLKRYSCHTRLHLRMIVQADEMPLCESNCVGNDGPRCECFEEISDEYTSLSVHATVYPQAVHSADPHPKYYPSVSHRLVALHLKHHNPQGLGLIYLHADHWTDPRRILSLVDARPQAFLLMPSTCHSLGDDWDWSQKNWDDSKERCEAACSQVGCAACCSAQETMFYVPPNAQASWVDLVGTAATTPGPFHGVFTEVAVATIANHLNATGRAPLQVVRCLGGPSKPVSWDAAATAVCGHKVDLAHVPTAADHPALRCR